MSSATVPSGLSFNGTVYPRVAIVISGFTPETEIPDGCDLVDDGSVKKYVLRDDDTYHLDVSGNYKFASVAEAMMLLRMEYPDAVFLVPKRKYNSMSRTRTLWLTFPKYAALAGMDFKVVNTARDVEEEF